MSKRVAELPSGYSEWLAALKLRIREARLRASLSVNAELIGLYWRIGRDILDSQDKHGWVRVFDADAAVHRLQAPGGRALPQIAAQFPGTVTHGVLDRAALRGIVLKDREKLRQLEKILHPLVRAEQKRFLARAQRAGARLAVLDIPLLFESGGTKGVDYTMVVSAPPGIQVARVRRRQRMSEAEISRVIALQMPDAEKRRRADVVVRTGLSRFHAVRCIKRWLQRTLR